MYTVSQSAYTGCSPFPKSFAQDDQDDARRYVARLLRRRRNAGFPVVRLGEGYWEVQEPDDISLIPDECGTVTLTQAYRFTCPECGTGQDDQEDVARCCTWEESTDEE